jgi:hypothetical protein
MAIEVTVGRPEAFALHPFEGLGAQLNVNMFRPDGQPTALTQPQHDALRTAIENLKPGHSRVFLHRVLVERPQPPEKEMQALLETLRLAEAAGAKVNLTFWGQGSYADVGTLKALRWPEPALRDWPRALEQQGQFKWPDRLMSGQVTQPAELMRRFAHVIERTRRERLTCVTHATIHNEPNGSSSDLAHLRTPGLSMRLYEWLYRRFDEALRSIPDPLDPAKTLKDAIQVVGGDLLLSGNSPQDEWLAYLRNNMDLPRPQFPCVIDGYSIHVYWDPAGGATGFPKKLEDRLEKLPATLRRLGIDKPVYVTEYGVKKNGAAPEPGGPGSGQAMEFSAGIAFQHAWFNALAPQCGCVGLAKWVLYRTDADGDFGEWGMIDAPNAGHPRTPFGRSPAYRMTRLFTHLTDPGWKAAGVGRDAARTILVSKFAGGGGESYAVLNRSKDPQDVHVVGLKPHTTYFGAEWNRDTKGGLAPFAQPFTTGDANAHTVNVPGQGIVAFATRPLRL